MSRKNVESHKTEREINTKRELPLMSHKNSISYLRSLFKNCQNIWKVIDITAKEKFKGIDILTLFIVEMF